MKEVSKHLLKHLRQHEKGQWRNSPKTNIAMFPFSEEYTIYSCLDSGTQNKPQMLMLSLITTI